MSLRSAWAKVGSSVASTWPFLTTSPVWARMPVTIAPVQRLDEQAPAEGRMRPGEFTTCCQLDHAHQQQRHHQHAGQHVQNRVLAVRRGPLNDGLGLGFEGADWRSRDPDPARSRRANDSDLAMGSRGLVCAGFAGATCVCRYRIGRAVLRGGRRRRRRPFPSPGSRREGTSFIDEAGAKLQMIVQGRERCAAGWR